MADQPEGPVMGAQPTSRMLSLEKEVRQLQVANNELTAELYRLKENERIRKVGEEEGAAISALEDAEDALWKAQYELKMEKSYAKGFATIGVLSSPATVALLLWVSGTENGLLTAFGIIFGIVFGAASLTGLAVTIAKIFGAIPQAKREVAQKQRHLDRLTLKELGL